jgi:hypothetical protein
MNGSGCLLAVLVAMLAVGYAIQQAWQELIPLFQAWGWT